MELEELAAKSFFPFLFVLYFVLSIYQNNIGQTTVIETLRPLTLLLAATGLTHLALYRHLGDRKAGLITFTAAFILLTYGIQARLTPFGDVFLVALNATVGLGIVFHVIRSENDFSKVVKTLNFFTAVLLATVFIGLATAGDPGVETGEIQSSIEMEGDAAETPDIYYIVPDRYPSDEVLEKDFEHDNSGFTEFLVDEGFYVANASFANYPSSTYQSLTSALNMQYLDEMGVRPEHERNDFQPALEGNEIQQFLQSHGYNFHNIGFDYRPTQYNRYADNNTNNYLEAGGTRFTAFEHVLIQQTALDGLLRLERFVGDDFHGEKENFRAISEASGVGPDFVFSHHKLPHPPFRMTEELDRLDPEGMLYEDKFVHQVEATNKLLKEEVESILEDDEDSIIMIVSDQGPVGWTWEKAGEEDAELVSSAYIAVHAPEAREDFYPEMTPVNTNRIVMNNYFDTDLPLLEDNVYMQENESTMQFRNVNELIGLQKKD